MPHCTALSIPFKTCVRCGINYPRTADFFHRSKSRYDGFNGWCKICQKAYIKRYRQDNLERLREYDRERYPARKEEVLAYGRQWYRDNREEVLAQQQAYRDAHRDEKRRRDRKWYQANRERVLKKRRRLSKKYKELLNRRRRDRYREDPERALAVVRRRRARKMCVGGGHTAKDIQRQYDEQNGKCWWCLDPVGNDYHVDHLVPLAEGGHNGPSNLVIACPSCNLSKGAKMPHEFAGRLL